MIGKRTADRAVAVLAAVATPVVTLLVDQGVLSTQGGVDVGAIVAATVAAWHGGSVAQARLSSPSVPALDDTP